MVTPDDCPMRDQPIMQATLVDAAREILSDDDLMNKFWRAGYEAFSGHAIDGTKRWFGSKILAAIGAALFGAGVYLIGRFGR